MNILCIICSDLLTKPDDMFYTRCGHVFHFQCLTQWIERSKSCPQCREKVTHSRIHKLYVTLQNTEINTENDPQAQDRLTSLKFQIMLKEKDINFVTSKNVTLEKQNAGLRKEVRTLESVVNEKNSAIHALKEQTKFFKDQLTGYERAKKDIVQLKNKIEELRNLQMLLDAPMENVKDVVNRDKSPGTLITYIYILKKEVTSSKSEIERLKIKVKNLQDEHAKMTMRADGFPQNYSSNSQLQEQFAFCESEKMALQSRVNELEKILGIRESPKKSINVPEEDKSNREVTEECLGDCALQISSSSRKRSYRSLKRTKKSMEKEDGSCSSKDLMEDDNNAHDLALRSTDSDPFIPLKKRKLCKVHEKRNDTNNVHKEDIIEDMARGTNDPSTSTNSKTSKDKNENIRKDKLSKTKHRNREIIDLT